MTGICALKGDPRECYFSNARFASGSAGWISVRNAGNNSFCKPLECALRARRCVDFLLPS
jgi:hypothetical protein